MINRTICPICNNKVDRRKSGIGSAVNGVGKFETQVYFHVDCFNKQIKKQNEKIRKVL